MSETGLRFVTEDKIEIEKVSWGQFDWLSRPGFTDTEQLMLIRVHFPAGLGHMFHRHPHCEEIIYLLEGEVEQWVEQQSKTLRAGQCAHIPMDTVHGTYNLSDKPAIALAIFSPAKFDGPLLVDVYDEEPWKSLKAPLDLPS